MINVNNRCPMENCTILVLGSQYGIQVREKIENTKVYIITLLFLQPINRDYNCFESNHIL